MAAGTGFPAAILLFADSAKLGHPRLRDRRSCRRACDAPVEDVDEEHLEHDVERQLAGAIARLLAMPLLAAVAQLGAQTATTDWPALGRYRQANAQLSPPEAGENRVVFMGNSITEGWAPDPYNWIKTGDIVRVDPAKKTLALIEAKR